MGWSVAVGGQIVCGKQMAGRLCRLYKVWNESLLNRKCIVWPREAMYIGGEEKMG